jgi:cytochrome c oxidase assembly factor CtaG
MAQAGTVLPFSGPHLAEFLPPVLACVLYLGLYWRRTRTLAGRGAPVSGWRIGAFASGAALAAAIQVPPFDSWADQVLAVHMTQHVLLGDVCSLLIVLGLTGPIMRPLLQLRVGRVTRLVSHPITALVLWAVDLYVWHLPVLYQAAIRHDLVHALEHACLLWFGVLLWISLLGPLPKPRWFSGWAGVVYVIGVRTVGAVLGNVFIWTQSILYPLYVPGDAAHRLSPLSDQAVAGAIMMVEQMILTAVLLGWLFVRWLRQEGERQDLLDLASAQRIELSDERAARAAVSGSTGRLRERLLQARGSDPAGP